MAVVVGMGTDVYVYIVVVVVLFMWLLLWALLFFVSVFQLFLNIVFTVL